jgi:hypothetical protein
MSARCWRRRSVGFRSENAVEAICTSAARVASDIQGWPTADQARVTASSGEMSTGVEPSGTDSGPSSLNR